MEDSQNFIGDINKIKKPEEIKDLRNLYQLGEEGVSSDYINYFMQALMNCKSLLDLNYKMIGTEEYKKKIIFKSIKEELLSYTEYMNQQGSSSFLTSKGKDMVRRLDEIVTAVKNINNDDLSKSDITSLEALLTEALDLISNQ